MYPIFVIKFSGVSDLQGVKVPDFPLTLLVIVTTVLRYHAACDRSTRSQCYHFGYLHHSKFFFDFDLYRFSDIGRK